MVEYKLSYTAGSLLLFESETIIEAYFETRDWTKAKKIVIEENRLQSRMQSSSKRILNEVVGRVKTLSNKELELFINSTQKDRVDILWYAICKKYPFIADFAVEVIREKYLTMDYLLTEDDYISFFSKKCEWHPEIEKLKESTKKKAQQVLFRILKEVDIIDKNNMILASLLNVEIAEVLKRESGSKLTIYPLPETKV